MSEWIDELEKETSTVNSNKEFAKNNLQKVIENFIEIVDSRSWLKLTKSYLIGQTDLQNNKHESAKVLRCRYWRKASNDDDN